MLRTPAFRIGRERFVAIPDAALHQTLRISLCHPVGDDCSPDAVFPSWMRGLSLEGGLAPGAVGPRGLYRLVHENALRRRGQPTALDPVLLVHRGLDATPARDRFHCAVNSRFDDALGSDGARAPRKEAFPTTSTTPFCCSRIK